MFEKLRPSMRAESIFGCDFDSAYAAGYRGLILDIDNTLVPHNAPIDERSRAFLLNLRGKGFRLMIISNNHEPRARDFAAPVGIPYICDAKKPGAKAYGKAVAEMGLKKEEVLCIGDQLLTDIWGANNAGIRSLLTEPLDRSTDTLWIHVKRVLEIPIKHLHNVEFVSKISKD